MERLTLREANGCVLPGFENNGVNGCYDIPDAEWLEESIDRLAAIEDILGDDYGLDRLRELVEADREDAVHIGACGFCEYYQMDKFCCCPDWVEDGYAVIRKPKDYCTKFKKAGWVDEVWGENGCPSCPGHLPTALKAREQDG